MAMTLPSALPSLSVREAVTDALYRCVAAFDNADEALFSSALTSDARFDLDGRVMDGLDAIRKGCYDVASKLDTTHFITNVRVDIKDGASTASLAASALAQHYRPGQGREPGAPRFLAGTLYFLELVKDDKDGLWKIKDWRLKVIWGEGDYGVLTGN